MSRRLLSMLAPFLVLASSAVPEPRPLVSVQCDRCGLCLPGIDAERGMTRCRECSAPPPGDLSNGAHSPPAYVIGVDHGAGPDVAATVMMRRIDAGYTVVCAHRKPIEVVCPACRAQPGEACDRRTMGRRWMYHLVRVDAAGGGG